MPSDVITLQNSYFSVNRFEKSLTYTPFRAEKAILRSRKNKIIDRIIIFILLLLMTFTLIVGARILFFSASIAIKDREILKLTETLNSYNQKYNEAREVIKANAGTDGIMTVAFLKLNMITPTEKNIIYFEKSEAQ